MKTDILIVGSGVSGLYCALNLPKDKKILIITKKNAEDSDSYLAQGGICMLKDSTDYNSYFEDTMRAGHYENNKKSVEIMIKSSPETIDELIGYGVDFERDENGELMFTKEGAHSIPRILFHEDITGREITSKLLMQVRKCENVEIKEQLTMVDLLERDNECYGVAARDDNGEIIEIKSDYTVLATGGIGGLYKHSTNYRHLTGDALAVAIKHGVELLNIDYIQIHPTTLYSEKQGRRFLISESVRGEGAILLNDKGERFVDELLPRDIVAQAIFEEMKKDNKPYVWLSMENVGEETILSHFPNIYRHCLDEGYDITREKIPVVPSQHYFMGGIKVGEVSETSMRRLYAVGEAACNGVHGKNRLASNSLLESLVFAKRAALNIGDTYTEQKLEIETDIEGFKNCDEDYRETVTKAIEKGRLSHE